MSKNCQICYNKNTNDLLKCKQCKNNVCDVCFANIIFNNEKFNDDYMNNKTKFTCPYCKYHNVFNTKINNYNTNDKIIKLLIKQKNDKVDLFNNDIVEFNNTLMNELDDLKKIIYNLEDELSNVKFNNTIISNKLIESTAKLQQINDFNIVKYSKIIDVLNNTKRKTILFNEINDIINLNKH
jgi:hypothetical protein